MIKRLWAVALIGGMVTIWKQRNKVFFEDKKPSFIHCTKEITILVRQAHLLDSSSMYKSTIDVRTLLNWNLEARLHRAPRIRKCWWNLPILDMVKINCDGSSKGNPGVAGLGATCRNHTRDFLLVIWRKIGVNTNYLAECLAIVESAEVAVQRNWKKVWFESDSAAAIVVVGNGNMPWSLKNRWHKCKNFFSQCILSSIWREANFSADQAAKYATDMITEALLKKGLISSAKK
ncbi:hypothetical protein IFM89_003586 [Coptis chinensis]|uniref:RNase H type-1 domain-containing protein n=1 Tax=Coptis chinensis TaxID=261450 RepID=A0A835LWT5_9MAGN|nr:hypothetical protein IFM89_003586 [Coptis chinensis]